jgi:hypothetical protein
LSEIVKVARAWRVRRAVSPEPTAW